MEGEAHFCQRCGAALEPREVFGQLRPACPACGFVHYDDPKVAVGVVASRRGKILLTRRNHEPRLGGWSFPSGFVDAREDVRVAAVREAREETGIEVTLGELLGVYQESGSRVIYLAFSARAGEGKPVADAESIEVRFFPHESLPVLAFPHDQQILDAWSRRCQAGQVSPAAAESKPDLPEAARAKQGLVS